MESLISDMRYALRMAAKNPSFAVIAVLTLTLGMVACSTLLSWIHATLLDPVPGAVRAGELVTVMRGERSIHPSPPFSYPDYADLRERSRSFNGILAYHDDFEAITDASKPERIYAANVSANYFQVLGIKPILGSVFLSSEEEKPGRTPSVIISYGLWQRRYGSDKSIVGRTIHINRRLCTIVGVAPPGFMGCKTGLRTDLWLPLVYGFSLINERGIPWLNVMGRLKPGYNRQQAEMELDMQMRRIVEQHPSTHLGPNKITLDPLWRSPFSANIYLYQTLPILLALAVVLLLLACANTANLLLVNSMARRREIAIRLSLGANRLRLVRQLLLENLLLALASGGLAVLLTLWTAETLGMLLPIATLPIVINGRLDLTVVSATFAVAAAAALIFGILPALRTSHLAPVKVLKEESGSVSASFYKSGLARTLVVAQITLSFLLLVSAGLFVRSLQKIGEQDPGFDPKHVLLASYDLSATAYTHEEGIAFDRRLLAELELLPGVESATVADFSPLSFTIRSNVFKIDGYEPRIHESMEIDRGLVGPNYFRTMRTALISGRDFSPNDNRTSQLVAVVNEAFVRRYWDGKDPIGRKIQMHGLWFTVIGMARNAKYRRLADIPAPAVFLPLFQVFDGNSTIHVRVKGDPYLLASSVKNTVRKLNPELPVFNVAALASNLVTGSVIEMMAGTLAGAFGLIALLLAIVGIYGVVAYSTRRRTREIGLRLALGADPSAVFRLVLHQGLGFACVGVGLGLLLSMVLTRFISSSLFGVSTVDALTLLAVSILLCLVTLAACCLPARRAAKVNPTIALRYD